MPLEIRELIIKAAVSSGGIQPTGATTAEGNQPEANMNEVAGKVLQIIKEKAER